MENEGPGGQGQSASFGLNASRQCNRLAEDRHKAGAGRHNAAGDRALTGGLLTSIYPHWQFLCTGFNNRVLCLSLPVGACTTTLYQATEQVLRRDCWDETGSPAFGRAFGPAFGPAFEVWPLSQCGTAAGHPLPLVRRQASCPCWASPHVADSDARGGGGVGWVSE